MEFDELQKKYFSTEVGAFSKVTEREYFDSQVTLSGIEADIVIDYFGKENVHVGAVQNDKEKSLKSFLLYPHFEVIYLNLVFPKQNKRELRLYLAATKGFKPNPSDVLFIYVNGDKELVIGSCSEEIWKDLQQKEFSKNIVEPNDKGEDEVGIKVFNIANDNVINSYVGLGQSTYHFALRKVYPLANRFSAQRKFLESRFYERLERDLLKGCLMPPITLAFVEKGIQFSKPEELQDYIHKNMSRGYILDGLQRLNTLHRASLNSTSSALNTKKEIFYNIIIADNTDKLLYRMITLNNGQKPMSPRHQIEILTQELFDFDGLTMVVQSEKERSENPIKDAYSLGDLSKGYISFLTSNVHNENSKIIEEKMDQILVDRILNSSDETNKLQFRDIIKFMDRFNDNSTIREWLQTTNNFIGFCVGIKKSYDYIFVQDVELTETALRNFEAAFKIVNPSKVNVGKFRRELSHYFIKNAEELFAKDVEFISDKFVEQTISE